MTRFFLQLFTLFIFVGTGIWAWNSYGPVQKHLNDLWFILVFFTLITAAIHFLLVRSAADKKAGQFIRYFMGSTALKLFLYLIIMVVYGFAKPDGAAVFLTCFLIHYLIFTAFEVVSILKYLKK